ncbi:MAG: glycyl-radical enzyme activating protein [Verrucomicrobiota bacterium]|nr:glycyl-radical enzyme activating protein [Verrucomicrobiota bacterium]
MKNATGMVFAIERCSLNDGPGIRTTVFLKGCPLRCQWCHNPESVSMRPELYFLHERCILCGHCAEVCTQGCHLVSPAGHEIDRTNCTTCGACVEACPVAALEIKGRPMEVDDIMAVVEKDRCYYESSGGGLTISGGEPLFQFAFTQRLLESAKTANLHTCVETSAFAPVEHLLALVPLVDLFLIDWKETDPERHKQFTGVENSRIRSNILALDKAGARIRLRCPLIPGYNDSNEHSQGIKQLAAELRNLVGIDIMPFHPMGRAKNDRLGKSQSMPETDFCPDEIAKQWRSELGSSQ